MNIIGNSLSQCVCSILRGEVAYEDVDLVVAGTRIRTEDELKEVIALYQQSSWKNLKGAPELCRRFFQDGKILQPRLYYDEGPYGGPPCWYNSLEEYISKQLESGHGKWLDYVDINSVWRKHR